MQRQQSGREPRDGMTWAVEAIVVAGAVFLRAIISRVSGWSLGAAMTLSGLGVTDGVVRLIGGLKGCLHGVIGISGPATNRSAPRSPWSTDPFGGSSWPRAGHGQGVEGVFTVENKRI